MRINYSAKSDIGRLREENEDSYCAHPDHLFFSVADGVGGLEQGKLASQTLVNVFNRIFHKLGPEQIRRNELEKIPPALSKTISGIIDVNRELYNKSIESEWQKSATTVSNVLFLDGMTYITNVGDSRIYRIRDNDIIQLTHDHNWASEFGDENSENHGRSSNILTRAIGHNKDLKLDIFCTRVLAGDYYILCTDGLNLGVDDESIKSIVELYQEPIKICNQLIVSANDYSGKDNTTVIVVKIETLDENDYRDSYEEFFMSINSEDFEQSGQKEPETNVAKPISEENTVVEKKFMKFIWMLIIIQSIALAAIALLYIISKTN